MVAKKGKTRLFSPKNRYFVCIKNRFLNRIFICFQKIELIQRKTTQINTSLKEIQKSAKIGQQREGQALGRKNSKKRGKFSQKMGTFVHQKAISEPNFHFFSKKRVDSKKDNPNKHISKRN